MKKRIQINKQTFYVPCSADQQDPYRGESLRKEEVRSALKHLVERLGTRYLPWEAAYKLVKLYCGGIGGDDENIAIWWKTNFPETKPYIYCLPYHLQVRSEK